MEEFFKVFTNYSYQWIVAIFFSFLSYMARKFYNVYKTSVENARLTKEKEIQAQREMSEKESAEQALIKFGMLAILRFRVNKICNAAKSKSTLQ